MPRINISQLLQLSAASRHIALTKDVHYTISVASIMLLLAWGRNLVGVLRLKNLVAGNTVVMLCFLIVTVRLKEAAMPPRDNFARLFLFRSRLFVGPSGCSTRLCYHEYQTVITTAPTAS